MNQDALRKLDEQLNCSVCLDTYTNPKILHCFHVYCQKCLKKLVDRDEQGQLVIICPTCRKPTLLPERGVADLQTAFHVNKMMEVRRSFSLVVKQPSLPRLQKPAGNTEVDSTLERKKKDCCKKHEEQSLAIYCELCGELACMRCVAVGGSHQGHDFLMISDAFERTKDEIISAMEPMEKQLSSINTALQDMDDRHGGIVDQRAAIEAEIQESARRLQDTIDARKTELIQQLDRTANEKLKNLAAQHDQIETSQIRLNGSLEFIRESLRTSSQGEIIMMKTTLVKQVKDLTSATFQPESLRVSTEADMTFSVSSDINALCQNYGKVSVKGLGVPDVSKCHASGKGLEEATVGEESSVIFHALDCTNQLCDRPLENLDCEIVSELTKATIRGNVKQRGKGNHEYDITYRPTIIGPHLLKITIDGKHVRDSPFNVGVKASAGKLGEIILAITNVQRPWGVAVTQSGELVVSEYDGNCISIFSRSGSKIRSFGTFGNGAGQFGCPCGVAVDEDNNIYVADSHNYRIQKFTWSGQFLTSIGKEALHSSMPIGLAFNPVNKKIYTVDAKYTVTILNSDLNFNGSFGSYGISKGQFSKPYGIACDSAGKVYVTDSENHRVQMFTTDGHVLKVFGKCGTSGGHLKKPIGIAVNRDGNIYVSEEENRRVSVFNANGDFVTSFGYSKEKGQGLNGVRGMAVSHDGVVYVCDRGNKRILVF